MKRVFVRELRPYSVVDIARLMETDTGNAIRVIERLLADGILQYCMRTFRDSTVLSGTDEINAAAVYRFNWVGVVLTEAWLFVCYPKYIRGDGLSDNHIIDRMRTIFRVLRQQNYMLDAAQKIDDGVLANEKLPVMLRLLDLYDEYGEYSNNTKIFEINGLGSISWNRTLNAHFPLLSNGQPIYTELETLKTIKNEADFIMRLHRAVLTECSRLLNESGIGEILGLAEVWLSDESIDNMGDTDRLLWIIERERGTQFVTWKQDVLDYLSFYLYDRNTGGDSKDIQGLGTPNFSHIWEKVCKMTFGDLLNKRLRQLPLALNEDWQKRNEETLLNIIPRPRWERFRITEYTDCGNAETLIPDAVSFFMEADERTFCIFDAKYYVPSIIGKMRGQPGVESVAKQFLYQSAYRDFIIAHDFTAVNNTFLVPGDVESPRKMARVSFPGVLQREEPPFTNHVEMWMLPANDIYEACIRGNKLDMRYLQ